MLCITLYFRRIKDEMDGTQYSHEADKKSTHNFDWKTSRVEEHSGDLIIYGITILKWILKKWGMKKWVRLDLEMVGLCQHNDEPLGSLTTVYFPYLKVKGILHFGRCWSKDDLDQTVIATEANLLVVICSCILSNARPLLLTLLFFPFWFLAFSLQCFNQCWITLQI